MGTAHNDTRVMHLYPPPPPNYCQHPAITALRGPGRVSNLLSTEHSGPNLWGG